MICGVETLSLKLQLPGANEVHAESPCQWFIITTALLLAAYSLLITGCVQMQQEGGVDLRWGRLGVYIPIPSSNMPHICTDNLRRMDSAGRPYKHHPVHF